jgi:hypothetical protein
MARRTHQARCWCQENCGQTGRWEVAVLTCGGTIEFRWWRWLGVVLADWWDWWDPPTARSRWREGGGALVVAITDEVVIAADDGMRWGFFGHRQVKRTGQRGLWHRIAPLSGRESRMTHWWWWIYNERMRWHYLPTVGKTCNTRCSRCLGREGVHGR